MKVSGKVLLQGFKFCYNFSSLLLTKHALLAELEAGYADGSGAMGSLSAS